MSVPIDWPAELKRRGFHHDGLDRTFVRIFSKSTGEILELEYHYLDGWSIKANEPCKECPCSGVSIAAPRTPKELDVLIAILEAGDDE